ncbi:unnamed protein product, partial [Ectocarpus sp. 8 AP-2014]
RTTSLGGSLPLHGGRPTAKGRGGGYVPVKTKQDKIKQSRGHKQTRTETGISLETVSQSERDSKRGRGQQKNLYITTNCHYAYHNQQLSANNYNEQLTVRLS